MSPGGHKSIIAPLLSFAWHYTDSSRATTVKSLAIDVPKLHGIVGLLLYRAAVCSWDGDAALFQVVCESREEFADWESSVPIDILDGLDRTLAICESKHWDDSRCETWQFLRQYVAFLSPGLASKVSSLALSPSCWQCRQLPALVQKCRREVFEIGVLDVLYVSSQGDVRCVEVLPSESLAVEHSVHPNWEHSSAKRR